MRQVKVVIEQHSDGYVAYPVGLKGVVVGQGDTYDEALADVTSAVRFHVETFGADELELDSPLLDVFLDEAGVDA
jgi:predicted RNase H-like HicB family nuclease